jgi:hypothetical protein
MPRDRVQNTSHLYCGMAVRQGDPCLPDCFTCEMVEEKRAQWDSIPLADLITMMDDIPGDTPEQLTLWAALDEYVWERQGREKG